MSARPTRCQRPGCCNLLYQSQGRGRTRLWCSETCRKRQYDRECVVCGGRVDGTTPGRDLALACRVCAPGFYSVWTAEAIVCAIQEWADRNGGIPPAANDWKRDRARGDDRVCCVNHVVRAFGSWNAGIEAAGFEPHACGPVGGFRRPTDAEKLAMARRYAAGESSVAITADFNCTPQTVIAAARRAGVPIRPPLMERIAA